MSNDVKHDSPVNSSPDQKLIEKILLHSYEEQRKSRRWGVFFKCLTFAYLFLILIIFLLQGKNFSSNNLEFSDHKQHTAIIHINGTIAHDQPANANAVAAGLRKAFAHEETKAILLKINSPGGSPVQSGSIYDEIKRLRTKYPDIKVYAVITEIGASGAYYIAAAADEIYADKASLVGSIGVTGAGFGFVEAIEKLGIERRNYTSGKHKSFLDPFQPLKEEEKVFWEDVMGVVHNQFIAAVEAGRGDRLGKSDSLYSGLIWPGEKAVELGLVDGLGSPGYVAREIIGEEKIVDFTSSVSPLDKFTKLLGASIGEGIINYLLSFNSNGSNGVTLLPNTP